MQRTANEIPALELPDWLLRLVASTSFAGNVRELRNIAERITIIHRQYGDWEREAIERVFFLLQQFVEQTADIPQEQFRRKLDTNDRERIVRALDAHNWRRQDTADYLKMSRKVLWEKMRKLQISDDNADPKEMDA